MERPQLDCLAGIDEQKTCRYPQCSSFYTLPEDLDDLPDLEHIVLPDFYTGDYIVLDILKSNSLDISRGEKLKVQATPTIGTGSQNAIYSPVGTVSFKFNIDDSDKINEIFLKNIEYKNSERLEKGLKIISEEEKVTLQKSFNLLDKERVYKEMFKSS